MQVHRVELEEISGMPGSGRKGRSRVPKPTAKSRVISDDAR
jgi:hypothetical protein